MSSISIPVYTCDRCGYVKEMRRTDSLYSWGEIQVRQVNGPFAIGDGKKSVDICPTCVATFKSWWTVGKDACPTTV